MADENTVTVAHKYADENGVDLPNFGVADFVSSCATLTPTQKVQDVGTSEEALDIDGLTAAGALCIMKNTDDTNYVEVRSGTGASNDIIKILAGECQCWRFGSDITAPYIVANQAAVKVQFRLIPA